MLGQFKNKAVQDKVKETKNRRRAEAAKKKEAVEAGFSGSHMSDPDVQAAILNDLVEMALDDSDINLKKWAIDMLVKQGAFKLQDEKQVADVKTIDEDSTKEAVKILKQKSEGTPIDQ